MKYCFIINPISGRIPSLKKIRVFISHEFSNHQEASYQVFVTEEPGDARRLAKEAAEKQTGIVVAVGGDGTMNEVACGIMHSDAALGVVPCGSGNGFAQSLSIPESWQAAIRRLVNPDIIRIDAGQINDAYFFGVAGCGFDALISARFKASKRRGVLPYFYHGIREFFRFEPELFRFESDSVQFSKKLLMITIANTARYGNGAVIAPHADYQDGKFEVCMIDKISAGQAIINLPYLFNNKIEKFKSYKSFSHDNFKIIRESANSYFHTDGEPHRGGKVLQVKVLPKALRVCV